MPLSTDAWTPRAAQRPSPSGCDEAAQAAILAREVKPSLVRMCSTWFSAVRCEITSSAAITSPRSTTPPASWPVTAALHTYTGIIGTSVSGTFLYLIAALNAVILHSIIKVFQQMRTGKYSDEELERQLDARGLMNRIFGGNARRIGAPWKMYPVGCCSGWASTPPPRSRCSCWPAPPWPAGCRSTRCCRCRSCSPPGCPVRHRRRVLHELRLPLGVRPAGPQGVLQPDHHRAVGVRRVVHRHHR